MRRQDINKKFTEKVAQYIAEGYVINTLSMCGHQGEDGKVDLYKDGTVVRVWLWKESAPWNRTSLYEEWKGSSMVLRVGKISVDPSVVTDSWVTLWMDKFELIEEITYYAVGEHGSDWYVDNLEEAIQYQVKHYERAKLSWWDSSDNPWRNTPAHQEIGANYLKRKHGYKRVRKNDISIKKMDEGCYRMSYAGNTYYIQ